jgi:hypothetical protein
MDQRFGYHVQLGLESNQENEVQYGMKIYRMLCLGAALALPSLVLAKMPLPNDAFGRLEGVVDFCAQADPQSAAKYQEQKKVLVQGATDEEVAEARASKEYKDGYDEATQEMGKQPKDQVAKACAAALGTK